MKRSIRRLPTATRSAALAIAAIAAIVAIAAFASVARAAPLTIDLTKPPDAPAASPYGPGAATNPQGHTLTADTQAFLLDGKPWAPVAGEFHYSRYPRDEWRDELLKMRAGGINTVSTYVIWIHHEEERGKFDWSGQRSLRDFLSLCKEVGLNAVVRMGPYVHGEVRNGGLPDWVLSSHTNLRTKDPAFMKLVEPFYVEQAKQMQGLLWKDGGPVVAVQLDNECEKGDYLFALKAMARGAGVDVPFYFITGWQGGVPSAGLIPMFGGYLDGFWGGSREEYRREVIFTESRAVNDLGAQLTIKKPGNAKLFAQFPYACAEIGPGMMSSYGKRIKTEAADAAAMALAKLGSGNNMPGYYMYQGGVNPDGKRSTLQEDHPNQMPVKNYDYACPLDSNGGGREIFNLLREQHVFLQEFGPDLARMPARFPALRPSSLKDFATLRWAVRWDGRAGFLFYNNRQPYEPLPEHRDVQFELATPTGSLLVPRRPTTIPTGSYGIWPINLDCNGVTLEYATAQPLCRIEDQGAAWYFFAAQEGVPAELSFVAPDAAVTADSGMKEPAGGRVWVGVTPGPNRAASVAKPGGGSVNFVVLTPAQSRQFYRVPFGGQDRAVLSSAIAFQDGAEVRLQAPDVKDLNLAVFPPVRSLLAGTTPMEAGVDGVFARFSAPGLQQPKPLNVALTLEKPAGPRAKSLKGGEEATWEDAAVYTVSVPAAAADRRLVLEIQYTGDAARLYAGNRLLDDHFYNGEPFATALWRIPAADRPNLRLKVLPYSDGLRGRLPAGARQQVERAKNEGALDRITATTTDQLELRIASPAAAAR